MQYQHAPGHLQADPRPVTCARRASTASSMHPSSRLRLPSRRLERSQIREMRDLHGPRSTGAGLVWSALLCSAAALPPGLQLQRRHDKMVAALLHRELRVSPWARQRGLLAFGCACVPRSQHGALAVCAVVPSGAEQGRRVPLESKTRESRLRSDTVSRRLTACSGLGR